MAVNPLGYQNITDGGTPRIITGYAKAVVSGGNLVGASGAAGVVASGTASFATTDIEIFHLVDIAADTISPNFVGIALHNAESGAPVSVATRGSFLLTVSGANVEAGWEVGAVGESNVSELAIAQSGAFGGIGRAWTCGSEDDFVVVDIHG